MSISRRHLASYDAAGLSGTRVRDGYAGVPAWRFS
jgi:hypothetical protein